LMVSITTARSALTATSLSSCGRWRRSTGSISRPTISPLRSPSRPRWRPQNESPRASCDGTQSRQVHRVSYLLCHLQECVDQSRGHGICLVQQRRNQAWYRLSERLGEPGPVERWLAPQEERQDRTEDRLEVAGVGKHLCQSGSA